MSQSSKPEDKTKRTVRPANTDEELNAAANEVKEKEDALRKAEDDVKAFDDRERHLHRIMELEDSLLSIVQKKTENLSAQIKARNAEIEATTHHAAGGDVFSDRRR